MNKLVKLYHKFFDIIIEYRFVILTCFSILLLFSPILYTEFSSNKVLRHYIIKKDVVLLEQNTVCNKGYCNYKTNYGIIRLYYKEVSKLLPNTRFDLFIKLGTKEHKIYAKVYTDDNLMFNYYYYNIDTITKRTQKEDYNFFLEKYNVKVD